MESASIVLLISVLGTTGLLALWAALSRRHWFLRTGAFLAALSPLLAAPAYEPFVTLAAEGLIIASGVAVVRRIRAGKQSEETAASPSSWRFSMETLLLAMALCGLAAFVASRMPTLNRPALQSMALTAVCGGVTVVLGYVVASALGLRRVLVFSAAALLFTLLLATIPAKFDWLLTSLAERESWPPRVEDPSSPLAGILGVKATFSRGWFVILPALLLATAIAVVLVRGACSFRLAYARAVAWLALLAGGFFFVSPSIGVLTWLLFPDPIPRVAEPNPNGLTELVAAGNLTQGKLVNSANYDPDTATRQQVATAAAEVQPAIALARSGLEKEILWTQDYSRDDLGLTEVQELRGLSRAFSAVAQSAVLNKDYDSALLASLDDVRLGALFRRGGLLVQGLVGIAITGVSSSNLFDIRKDLSTAQCRRAIQVLQRTLNEIEPYEILRYRDKIYEQHAYGWFGRVLCCLESIEQIDEYQTPFDKEQAVLKLLIAELSLRCYVAERGTLPDDWRAVKQLGLPPLMTDPWSPEGAPLKYVREGADYKLYSVGINGVDNGGAGPGPGKEAWEMSAWDYEGDYLLEFQFAPTPPTAVSDTDKLDEPADAE